MSNHYITVSDNTVSNAGTSSNNSFDVFDMNQSDFVANGNMVVNVGSNIPTYIFGGTSDRRVITANWMFGARSGYLETAPSGLDVYANNLERGGIG